MKSYNEMAQNVLCRMNEYETTKKKQRARFAKAGLSLCCLTMVFLLGISMQLPGLPMPEAPTTADNMPVISIPDKTEPSTTPVTTVPTAPQVPQREDVIIINEVDGAPEANRMGIALMLSDYLPMDKAELCSYYGVNVFPTVPAGLTERDGQGYGIFRRDGGCGKVYWEQNHIEYFNEDQTRCLTIAANNGSLPYQFSPLTAPEMERSVINGVEVVIGQWDAQCYFAEFMYENVGFLVSAEGLALDELLAVINSLIV